MTSEEWGPISALIENLWKDDFDKVREDAYFQALQHYEGPHVLAAVVDLAGHPEHGPNRSLSSAAYSPSAEQIARRATHHAQVGTWDWAVDRILELANEALGAFQLRGYTGERPRVDDDDVPEFSKITLVNDQPVYGALVLRVIDELGGVGHIYRQGLTLTGPGRTRSHLYLRGRQCWARLTLEVAESHAHLSA